MKKYDQSIHKNNMQTYNYIDIITLKFNQFILIFGQFTLVYNIYNAIFDC